MELSHYPKQSLPSSHQHCLVVCLEPLSVRVCRWDVIMMDLICVFFGSIPELQLGLDTSNATHHHHQCLQCLYTMCCTHQSFPVSTHKHICSTQHQMCFHSCTQHLRVGANSIASPVQFAVQFLYDSRGNHCVFRCRLASDVIPVAHWITSM